MSMWKKAFFVCVNFPFLVIGFIAAMIVFNYEVGTKAYEQWVRKS